MVSQRLAAVVEYLHLGLEAKVFSEETKDNLDILNTVLDSAGLRAKIKSSSPALTSSLTWRKFFIAAEKVDSNMLVEEEELRLQYRDYCRVLSSLEGDLDSMQIFENLFDPEKELFLGIESILAIIGRGMVSMSVESVAETWISILESHNTKVRNLQQDSIEHEMMVAINGPEVDKCDTIVIEAMELYWSKAKRENEQQGHFVRKWGRAKKVVVGAAVDKMTSSAPMRKFLM